jgi:hypothetical protein
VTGNGTGTVAAPAGVTGSPVARRTTGRTWKDPRLAVGVVIVAACALLGARLLGGADDSVAVWAVRTDLAEGAALDPGALEPQEVRFASPEAADRYLSAAGGLPDGAVLLRGLGAGELLPRAAVGTGEAAALVEVPLAVAADAVPATVGQGSVVDVWVTPDAALDRRPGAVRVLDDVVVVAAPRAGSALGPAATRQVVVGLPAEDEGELPEALSGVASGAVVIVGQG